MIILSLLILLFIYFLSVSLSVFAEDSFYFSTMPQSRNVVEGSDITIDCDVSDRQHIIFQWMFRGKLVVNSSRRFQDNSNLRILRVSRDEDDGPFTCIATNITTGFSLQSSNAKLNIQCKYYFNSIVFFCNILYLFSIRFSRNLRGIFLPE